MSCLARRLPVHQPSAAAPSLLLCSPSGRQELRVPGRELAGTPGLGVRSECCQRRARPCHGVSCFFVSRRPRVFPAVFKLLRGGGGVPAPPPLHPQQGPGAPTAPAMPWHAGGLPGSWRAAALPLELRIPVALRAVIWLSPDYGAAKALISASLICLKEPVCNNLIKAT